MNKFADAITYVENLTRGENGHPALKSTGSHLLDFFYNAASLRTTVTPAELKSFKKEGGRVISYQKKSNEDQWNESDASKRAVNLFFNAFEEEPILAVCILFWLRDIRGGAGERQSFRTIYKAALNDVRSRALVLSVANLIPEYGRWDDLWNCLDPFDETYEAIFDHILDGGLKNPATTALLAKWLPRESGKTVKLAHRLAQILKMDPKGYRRTAAILSRNTVEQTMSARKWEDLVFEHVPSVAMTRYNKAFNKNAGEAFFDYKQALVKGKKKVNAAAVYPYDIIRNLEISRDDVLANEQWKALPNYIPDGMSILPMVDVSGSMMCKVSNSVSALDVAVSLGMYCAERQTGAFKDLFMTFSNRPEFVNLKRLGNTLSSRVSGMHRADWEMNTDFDAALKLLLSTAVTNRVPEKDMVSSILILSDMMMDECGCNKPISNDIKLAFRNHCYKVPHIVFWNLRDTRTAPASCREPGVSMVSGFSPTIMKNILSGTDVTPLDQMLEVITDKRYLPVIQGMLRVME